MNARRRLLSTAVALAVSLLVGTASGPAASAGTASRPDAQLRAAGAPLRDTAEFGAFVDGMVADPSRLTALEQRLGARMDVASYFYGYGDEFPAAIERRFADGGRRKVLLSWDMGPYRFSDWSSGRHDAYLRRIGAHAAAYPYEVHVRPWPEMNGDWQTFQPTADGRRVHGGTPAEFVRAWRHVVTTVRAAGGTNVKWVFNPTADVYAETTDIRTIWPGAAYVDVLGLDGYNWGTGGVFRWRSFADIFRAQYERITALHPTAPVWICEFGSKEPTRSDGAPVDPTNDKGRWISDAFARTDFPRITLLAWFDIAKERDWRIGSSASSERAVREALAAAPVAAPAPAPAVKPKPRTTRTVLTRRVTRQAAPAR